MTSRPLVPGEVVTADGPPVVLNAGRARVKDANRSHAKLRGPGERANAQLKNREILTELRCCPHRAGHLAKAIHVLQNRELNAR